MKIINTASKIFVVSLFTISLNIPAPRAAAQLKDCNEALLQARGVVMIDCSGIESTCNSAVPVINVGDTGGGGDTGDNYFNTVYPIVGGGSEDGNPAHILSYLEGLDEQKAAEAINVYIQQKSPTSPFVGLGSAFVAGGKKFNVNPFLAVGHIQRENGFATAAKGWHNPATLFHTKEAATPPQNMAQSGATSFNAFGREGNRKFQPVVYYWSFTSNKLRTPFKWTSWKASLDGSNGTEDSWFTLINRRYLGNRDESFKIASGDFKTYLSHYAPQGDGNNEALYINGLKDTIDAIVGLMGTGVHFDGQQSGPTCDALGDTIVNVEGYSFPLAPRNKTIGGIKENQTTTLHHDGTPAFDLFSSVPSAPVYAIFDGVVTEVDQAYHGVKGCSSIQLKATNGFYYWYGHLKRVGVQKDQPVKSGQQMAEVADIGYGSECFGGGPHLHIDRGCTKILAGKPTPQPGGSDNCRDPDFIPFLSKMFSELSSGRQ